MGIRFRCHQCRNKINVKDFLAGKKGICPKCETRVQIPMQSEAEFLSAPAEVEVDIQAQVANAINPQPVQSSAPVVAVPVQPVQPLQATVAPTPANFVQQQSAMPAVALAQPVATAVQPAQVMTAMPIANPMPAPVMPVAPMIRDPIAERPTAQWYVRHANGQQYGPAPAPMFQKWIAEGRVPGDGLVWREDWPEWQSAAVVFPQLAGAMMLPAPVVGAPAPSLMPSQFGAPASTGPVIDMASSSPASQTLYRRRDNNKTMLVVCVVLFLLIIVGIIMLVIFINRNKEEETAVLDYHNILPVISESVTQ
jgi:hypothetical protein